MSMDRRDFLKLAGTVGITFASKKLGAKEVSEKKEFVGVLTDTTRCIGCRSCEKACSEAHNLYVPDVENDSALNKTERSTTEKQWTIVNRYETEKGEVFVKKQCMHCWQPACASACLTNAMYKTKDGPVIWRSDKCMGCRFCMVSCPFDIPKFEYHEWNPKIQKCNMCWERLEKGKIPACVKACPTDTLMFGVKRELMEIARSRIYNHPKKYVHRIYGEHEVGGTGWLYLSAVPFEQLGFRTDLGTMAYPEFTRDFLYAVPVVLFGLPALLLGLNFLTERREEVNIKETKEHE
jgi:Fe-S-cluster-containing dehydrogenase component